MGFARLLPRSSSRDRDSITETEPEVDVSEVTPDPAVELSTFDMPVFEEEAPPIAAAPVASAPVVVPQTPAPGATGTRVIVFANQKGGVAKTTTTLNLGVAFKEMGYRVLL